MILSVFLYLFFVYRIVNSACIKPFQITGEHCSPLRMFTHFRLFAGEQYSPIRHLSPISPHRHHPLCQTAFTAYIPP
nr:MAG TPA: hypothetical protein [Inoviridae sp.]